MRSTPSCLRPPPRGACQVSVYQHGPCAGKAAISTRTGGTVVVGEGTVVVGEPGTVVAGTVVAGTVVLGTAPAGRQMVVPTYMGVAGTAALMLSSASIDTPTLRATPHQLSPAATT